MADFTGMARTNTFRVKDREAFINAISMFDLEVQWRELKDGTTGICLITNSDYGDWPSYWMGDDDLENEFDWAAEMPQYLAEGETMVIMECGHEKARYCSGWAVAIHSSGHHVSVSLNDIYQIAATTFGVPIDAISNATY